MSLADIDRRLLDRCLAREPGAWEEFVDRFLGLIVHVIKHVAQARSVRLLAEDRDDVISEVFLAILRNDYGVLRNFRGNSSLATYLTVIARRVAVKTMAENKRPSRLGELLAESELDRRPTVERSSAETVGDEDQIDHLLDELERTEAEAVRLFHLEGKTYQEISQDTGLPVNTVGPTLTRARAKMRRAGG